VFPKHVICEGLGFGSAVMPIFRAV